MELISDPDKVLPLARKQEIQQVAFVAAYGEECVRPKHHHRMHLPRDILKLGFVPHCAPMEAKHRALKGGRIVEPEVLCQRGRGFPRGGAASAPVGGHIPRGSLDVCLAGSVA